MQHQQQPAGRATRIARLIRSVDRTFEEGDLVTRMLETNAETGWLNGPRLLLAELGLLDSPIAEAAIGLWFFQGCEDLLCTFESCEETVRGLSRSCVLGVITNGLHERQHHKFNYLGIAGHFQPHLFLASAEVGYQKPDARIFEAALERASLQPHEALHVGDILDVDVAGAQAAGMRGVWFNPQGRATYAGVEPDATIRSFGELPRLLERWR